MSGRAARAATIVGALLVAGALGALAVALSGHDPIAVAAALWQGALGGPEGWTETLLLTIPLALCALGVAVAGWAGLWNVGAQGQLLAGGMAAAGIGLFVLPGAPAVVLLPVMAAAGALAGALWAAGPAFLRAWWGTSEVITTLMLNYVAALLLGWLVYGPWQDKHGYGFPGTAPFPPAARLPLLAGRVHAGLLVTLLVTSILWWLLRHTRWGYELRFVGASARTARYAGMPVRGHLVGALLLAGALAGLAGMLEAAGVEHALGRDLLPGAGYTAILVAWVAGLNPLGTLIAAAGLAALQAGSDGLQLRAGLPGAVAPLLQGAILLAVLSAQALAARTDRRPLRLRWPRPSPAQPRPAAPPATPPPEGAP